MLIVTMRDGEGGGRREGRETVDRLLKSLL